MQKKMMMEWDKPPPHHHGGALPDSLVADPDAAAGLIHLQQQHQLIVMTDEQIEILRKQIAVYTILCEKLVEMHRSVSSQRDLSGIRIGNAYCDPSMISSTHKISARQRWAPTPAQLQILESIFDQGNGTPSKQKIKDITSELSQHGQVSETNVYNWFQNRRARAKRKQTVPAANNNESDGNQDPDSSTEKNAKEEKFLSPQIPASVNKDNCYRSSGMSSEAFFASEDELKPPITFSDLAFYDSILSNRRIDQLTGTVEVEDDYHPYNHVEDYNNLIG